MADGLAPTLASELFAEGNFSACIVECSRVLGITPGNETALLLKAVSELRSGKNSTPALKSIADSHAISQVTSCKARYELARAYWRAGKNIDALDQFKKVFISAGEGPLFIRASCSIYLIIKEHNDLAYCVSDIVEQLDTSSSLWTSKILDECRMPSTRTGTSIAVKPAEGLINFYRSQIGPAIGQRCSLMPSCSEYAMQSLKKHGLLGVAMIGDRMIREPSVVADQPTPVRIGNRWFYTDTVSEHDWWMKPNSESETNIR